MSETPGLPSALGIEAVQWLAQGENVTVRVQGRWRRRRPGASGQALLVVEALGQRHRFPAMPEPPSITGAAPGTWQMSFSVPAAIAPPHADRAWLQLGAVAVPLPLPVDLADDSEGEVVELDTLAQRRLRSTELALEGARRRTAEAELIAQELARSISELEEALEQARIEPERLRVALAELDRARRVAEQRAHAERNRRYELESQVAAREREAAADHGDELAASGVRIRELEHEVRRLVRVVDEAEHAAEAALATRERAALLAAGRPVAEGIAAERAALRRTASVTVAVAPAPAIALDVELLSREWAASANGGPAAHDDGTRGALRAQLESRARTEATLRAEIATLKGRLAAAPAAAPTAEIVSALADLRAELDRLGEMIEREASARAAAERRVEELERELAAHRARSARASMAIGRLRRELAALGVGGVAVLARDAVAEPEPEAVTPDPDPPATPEATRTAVDPERFSAALSRLREAAPAEPETAPEPEVGPPPGPAPSGEWLERAFRTLADRAPASAGALVLALLPAQPLVHPGPLAYDLVLDGGTCVRVTVARGAATVETRPKPRARSEVAFTVTGDPRRIARLLASGSLRRRLPGRRFARVRGDRSQAVALTGLLRAPANLTDLIDAGVTLDPILAFELAGAMIDPEWNAGESFVIAQRSAGAAPGSYLWVRDRARALVSQEPPQRPARLTIECADADLAPLLAGRRPDGVELGGEERLLGLIRSWIERAQRP